ncbi:fatty acid desaturase [Paraliomyxa miuraensis]|uniref:fatty acid desaturase n=1 Tax=Paraliomyxa miuraensis TaxID=376150 RepID=UPI00225B8848|nr:fatty acid desaturase [Paraliomyxa miuraensis]MCX4245144.1 fatty acid desaturase [Paraliomyxa miuraensis]
MDAVLIDEDLLSPERLRQLQQRHDGPSARKLAAQGLAYLASAIALGLVDTPLAIGVLLLVNATIQFGMFGMLHESCHDTVFTSRRLNRMAGWIAALAQPMSPALMRAFHFQHHRHTHELAHDPELGGLAFMVRWPRGAMWLGTMSGLPILMARVGWALFAALVPTGSKAWDRVLPFVRAPKRRRVAWEARMLLAVHGAAIACAVAWVPALWRVYIAMLVSHVLLSGYTTCEHRGLPEGGSILDRTRTMVVPAPIRWLLWNMPYHAEHHAWPAVPWHALPTVHALVRPHLRHVERPLALHLHGGTQPPPHGPVPRAPAGDP